MNNLVKWISLGADCDFGDCPLLHCLKVPHFFCELGAASKEAKISIAIFLQEKHVKGWRMRLDSAAQNHLRLFAKATPSAFYGDQHLLSESHRDEAGSDTRVDGGRWLWLKSCLIISMNVQTVACTPSADDGTYCPVHCKEIRANRQTKSIRVAKAVTISNVRT